MRPLLLFLGFFWVTQNLYASDLGAIGQSFDIAEPNLLVVIQEKIKSWMQRQSIENLQAKMQTFIRHQVTQPQPVAFLSKATKNRSFLFNPSIRLSQDLRLPDGRVLARAGDTINPLDSVKLDKTLVFFNADAPKECALALSIYQKTKGHCDLILVSGKPLLFRKKYQLPVYFDQMARLSSHLHLAHTPSIVTQAGKYLRVSEVLL